MRVHCFLINTEKEFLLIRRKEDSYGPILMRTCSNRTHVLPVHAVVIAVESTLQQWKDPDTPAGKMEPSCWCQLSLGGLPEQFRQGRALNRAAGGQNWAAERQGVGKSNLEGGRIDGSGVHHIQTSFQGLSHSHRLMWACISNITDTSPS